LFPKTVLGKWTMGLFLASILLMIFVILSIASGQNGGATIFDNLLISIPMISVAISTIASFFTGIISIIRKKERCIFVFISTTIGFLVLLIIVGEFLGYLIVGQFLGPQ